MSSSRDSFNEHKEEKRSFNSESEESEQDENQPKTFEITPEEIDFFKNIAETVSRNIQTNNGCYVLDLEELKTAGFELRTDEVVDVTDALQKTLNPCLLSNPGYLTAILLSDYSVDTALALNFLSKFKTTRFGNIFFNIEEPQVIGVDNNDDYYVLLLTISGLGANALLFLENIQAMYNNPSQKNIDFLTCRHIENMANIFIESMQNYTNEVFIEDVEADSNVLLKPDLSSSSITVTSDASNMTSCASSSSSSHTDVSPETSASPVATSSHSGDPSVFQGSSVLFYTPPSTPKADTSTDSANKFEFRG